MSSQIFTDLKEKYPKIISQMGHIFTSHEFILKITQQYQVEYIEALYLSRNRVHGEKKLHLDMYITNWQTFSNLTLN